MSSTANLCIVSVVISFIGIIYSVPHEFCLDHFNDGDCNKPPTPVFYYYKSGSRCEIRMWKGCPTLNKFPDEFTCSHFCIGRLWAENDEPDLESIDTATKEEWVEELEELDIKTIQEIDKLLDDVVDHTPQKLVYIRTTSTTLATTGDTTTAATKVETTEANIPEAPADIPEAPTDIPEAPAEPTPEAVEEEAATQAAETEAATEEPVTEAAVEPETTTDNHDGSGSAEEVITT